jgi:ParB family chromosome partitioning protein
MGHARALLGTTNRMLQLNVLKRILAEDLPVRAVEKLISASAPKPQAKSSQGTKEPYIVDLERRLSQFFGTRVTLKTRAKGGEMVVEWFSNEQFNGLVRKLGV